MAEIPESSTHRVGAIGTTIVWKLLECYSQWNDVLKRLSGKEPGSWHESVC